MKASNDLTKSSTTFTLARYDSNLSNEGQNTRGKPNLYVPLQDPQNALAYFIKIIFIRTIRYSDMAQRFNG